MCKIECYNHDGCMWILQDYFISPLQGELGPKGNKGSFGEDGRRVSSNNLGRFVRVKIKTFFIFSLYFVKYRARLELLVCLELLVPEALRVLLVSRAPKGRKDQKGR